VIRPARSRGGRGAGGARAGRSPERPREGRGASRAGRERAGRGARVPLRPAVFLDRDGTLTPEIGHVGASRRLTLFPETPAALRRLRRAGYLLVCVTNQSGVARGLYGRRSLERVLDRLAGLLEAAGTPLDAIYACPHHPDHGRRCRCRKPGTLMLRRAGRELGIDLRRSVSIGDRWSDVSVGQRVGGAGILIERPGAPRPGRRGAAAVRPDAVVRDLEEAARLLTARPVGPGRARSRGRARSPHAGRSVAATRGVSPSRRRGT